MKSLREFGDCRLTATSIQRMRKKNRKKQIGRKAQLQHYLIKQNKREDKKKKDKKITVLDSGERKNRDQEC
jgi:hypothetical protein